MVPLGRDRAAEVVEGGGETAQVAGRAVEGKRLCVVRGRAFVVAAGLRGQAEVVERGGGRRVVAQVTVERQRLLVAGGGARRVATDQGQVAEVVDRGEGGPAVTAVAGDRQALRVEVAGADRVAQVADEVAQPVEGAAADDRVGAGDRQRPLQPGAALAQVAAGLPELPERRRQPEAGRVGARHRPGQRGPQVVVLDLQPVEPGAAVRPVELGRGRLGQRQVPGQVPAADGASLGEAGGGRRSVKISRWRRSLAAEGSASSSARSPSRSCWYCRSAWWG